MPRTEHVAPPLPDIVGNAAAMQDVYRLVELAAPRSANVLLIGETGTGKEVIARAVHKRSRRNDGPYIKVNCGALHENLLESELFGHIKGSFTGAIADRAGKFEAAHGGSIFLDEVNSMSPKLQVKLLRVLQEREFERVGDNKTIRVNVRVIAATNARLDELVGQGQFREDLFYRLNVVPIVLPPLRDRRDDIVPLAEFFLRRYAERNELPRVPDLTAEVVAALKGHDWPGNVRELENAIERLVVLSDDGRLDPDLLRLDRPRPAPRAGGPAGAADVPGLIRSLVRAGVLAPLAPHQKLYDYLVGGVERELIEQVMRQCDDVQVKAAHRLGINRNTLHKKLDEFKRADLPTAVELPADVDG